jgi:segregation and condensation protein B
MPEDNIKAVIEALLFAHDRPVMIVQIRGVLGHLTTEQIRSVIGELTQEYEQSQRGLRIVEVAGGYQMITPVQFAPFLRKLFKDRRIERLSKPALETLAIIAYKQPLTKQEIESLRSVNVDGVMSSLVEKNLIRIIGRKDAPGRPYVFGTTKQFLEYFGLRSLEDLPKMEDFSKMVTEGQLPLSQEKKEEGEQNLPIDVSVPTPETIGAAGDTGEKDGPQETSPTN